MSETTFAGNARRGSRLVFAGRLGVGILLLVLVVGRVGVREPWRLLSCADPGLLAGAVAFYVLMFLIKTLRWRSMLLNRRIAVSFPRALELYLFSSLCGAFTPGRVGEALRAILPAREQKRYAESLACTAVDKAFDAALLALLLIAASRSRLLSTGESRALFLSGAALAALMAAGYGAARAIARRGIRLHRAVARLLPVSLRRMLEEQPDRFLSSGLACVRDKWVSAAALTALFWLAHVGCHYLILLSLGGSMDPWYFVLCLTLAGLVEFLPVTICGLGTREYLLVLLFEKAGLGDDMALAFALMNIVFTYAVTGILTMVVHCIRTGFGNAGN